MFLAAGLLAPAGGAVVLEGVQGDRPLTELGELGGSLRQQRPALRVVLEQTPQRGLVTGQREEEVGPPRSQPQRDDPPEGATHDVRRSEVEMLQERGEVIAVLFEAALRLGPLTPRVPSPVVHEQPEGLRQTGHHPTPCRGVHPGPMDQSQPLTGSVHLVVEVLVVHPRHSNRVLQSLVSTR